MSTVLKSDRDGCEVIDYDSKDLAEDSSKWDLTLGPGEIAMKGTRDVNGGVLTVTAVPFRTGADTIFDHAKYLAMSHDAFRMPKQGSLQFSVDIKATTPGTQPGRVIHGSYTTPTGQRSYAQPAIEGQQAAIIFNMTNVETGQVFAWFVSSTSAFALIERLPSNVTHPSLAASDASYVGLERAYTQIIKAGKLQSGQRHTFSIRYTRGATQSSVEYSIDGDLFSHVDHVGISLDTPGAPYTGVYPSYRSAPGEEVKARMNSFLIGHGLYSMLDAFPFQHPGAPDQAVSVPIAERLFGQGAQGEFSRFEVTTVYD